MDKQICMDTWQCFIESVHVLGQHQDKEDEEQHGSHLPRKQNVFSRLRHGAVCCRHYQDGSVHLRKQKLLSLSRAALVDR